LEKLARFIAWVIFGLSALLFQILVFLVLFAYQQTILSY
jgi:cell division protein FtsX